MLEIVKRIEFKKWLIFFSGLELIAIAINFFFGPLSIGAGGTTGLSILAEATLKFNRSLTVLVINILMLVLAAIFLGKKTTKNVLLGSIGLPILMEITPSFSVVDNRLLAVVLGSFVIGIGFSLLYSINASSGGTTIPPMIFKKYFSLSPTIGLLMVDSIVIVLNIFVDGWEAFLLAVVAQVATTLTMMLVDSVIKKVKIA